MLSAHSIFAGARRAALDTEALLLPTACLACEGPAGAADAILCAPCRLAMRPLAPPSCARCGQTLDPWARAGHDGPRITASCGFCRAWSPALGTVRSAVWLDDRAARRLVHALKYEGWRRAAEPMAAAIQRHAGAVLSGADALVPVPLGRTRRRERGYNQAAELAAALGRRTGLPVREDAVRRHRETRTQTELPPSARRANVAGAFAAADLAGCRFVLVDDVCTTGATLGSVAAALVAAGAAEVRAVTFARAHAPGADGR